MMSGHWGAWEPYTQTVTTGLSDVVTGYEAGGTRMAMLAYLASNSPFDNIYEDAAARVCAMQHVIYGASMSATWTSGFSACPILIPGAAALSSIVPPQGTGLTVQYVAGSSVEVKGSITSMGLIANTSTSHGMPSWQDPDNDAAPPQFDSVGGRLFEWDYAPFTAVDGELELLGVSLSLADLPFQLKAMRVAYGDASTWNNGDHGSQTGSVGVNVGGTTGTVIGGPQPLDDLTGAGHGWQFVSSLLAPGVFAGDDPYAATLSFAAWQAWAQPDVSLTIRRHGQRRRWLKTTPPLQQRQRVDGLGGGPVHAGRGVNTRQDLLFQRGIF